jgi:hypothetical protein
MDLCQIPPEEALGKCSWCGEFIPDDTPVFGFGGKKRPGVDMSEFEGGAIRISLVTEDRDIIAIITAADSEARRHGYDFMFMVCSESCASEMKTTLEHECTLGDAFLDEFDSMQN